jgi:phage terminase small subunit
MLKLTPKQRVFVDEFLIDLNATQAAKRAGYSKKTAQQMGAENLSKPLIAEAIAKALAERAERLKIDADWVLKRLVAEAEADLADLFGGDNLLKPVKDWPTIWRQGLVTSVTDDGVDG